MRKKLLSWLLVLSMALSMIPATVLPVRAAEPKGTNTGGVTLGAITATYDVSAQDADIEIAASGTYELTGAKEGISVIVSTADPVVLVLRGLTLSNVRSPIQLAANANVTLVLPKDSVNTLTCTSDTLEAATMAAQGEPTAKTAGINVPLGASLTIDRDAASTDYGTLTVTGGYGGAGIGGGAGVGLNDAKKGNNANGGGTGGTEARGWQVSTPGGKGWTGTLGQGGRFGNDAESAGSITINSGKLTVTAGSGAAGIGGGRGADGENATETVQTTTAGTSENYFKKTAPSNRHGVYRATNDNYYASGAPGTGGASGANGGTGGDAGDGGTVVITGGDLNVTGSEAPGIGGGKPGAGGTASPGIGASAPGTNTYSSYSNQNQRFTVTGSSGGRGQDGYSYAGKNGSGGSLEIKGGKLTASGTVSVGAGPVGSFTGGGGYNNGRQGIRSERAWVITSGGGVYRSYSDGGWGGGIAAPERKTGTAATIKINGSTDSILLPNGWDGNSALATRPEHVFADGSSEKLYKTEITVTRLDNVTKCADAELNLVLYRGNGAKQYTYSARTNEEGVATLWLPVSAYNSREKDVKKAYDLWCEGTEVSHRAVGRIMPGLAFGIEVKNNDNNKTAISIGVDFDASSSPNASKVYRSVDSETYELKPDDTRGVVNLVIDGSTVPVDMNITRLRWFREKINGNNQEYDYQQIGDKDAFQNGYEKASATNCADSKGENGAQTIDMTPEQGEVGKKPRVWRLPMKENGRYWVELTYQAPGEAEQRIVKGVVINNLYTSYPLWVHGRYVLDKDPNTAVMWFYGGENEVVPLRSADNQTWTMPYGIPWDLDGYDAVPVKNNDVTPDQATSNILTKDKILPSDQAGVIGGYDTVQINIIDRFLTFYNATVGNDGDTNIRYSLNKGAKDTPLSLTLNADFFSNQTTRYGEIVDGKQLFNRFRLTYIARDGALNIVFVTGVDEAGKELWNTVNMYTLDIKDATIQAWDRPGYILSKVEYTGSNNQWTDITKRNDPDTAANAIITDLNKMTAYFANVQDVKQLKFTYKKATTDVTIKAFYQLAEGETTEREIEGFVPYQIEATYGKPYTPKGAPTIPGFTYADKSNLKADGTIDVVDPTTLPETDRANANVIKYYYVKETGNVTYRAVVKGNGQDVADQTVWSEDKTVARNTAPETAAAGTYTPPTLTNYVISNENGANGNETITRKDNRNPATVYDGLHDLYVTYEYVQKTKDVTVKAIDVLTTKEIKLDEAAKKVTGLPTGEYKDISAPNLAAKGYTSVGATTQQCFVDATLGEQTVTFFYKPTENAETTVTLYYMDGAEEKTIQVLRNDVAWGSSLKVPAPTIAGYTLVVPQTGLDKETLDGGETKYFVTLNPLRGENGAGATGTSTKILYTKNAPTTVKVELKEQGNAASDLSKLLTGWTPTIEVEEGKSATATAPSIPNYKLADGETVKKTLKWAAIKEAVDANQTPTITFTYEKAEADLINIKVEGKLGTQLLYSYTKTARKSATEVVIEAFAQSGCKIEKVEMGGNAITGVVENGETVYKVDPAGESRTVTVTYAENTADVTINAYYKDTTNTIEGFSPFKVKAEIGKTYSYGPMTPTGFKNEGDIPSVTVAEDGTSVLNYYYTRVSGSVIYELVDATDVNKVLARTDETVQSGGVVDITAAKAPAAPTNWKLESETADGDITGAVKNDADKWTYDGINEVVVKYKAVPKTKTVSIERRDVDSHTKIELTPEEIGEGKTLSVELTTGASHTISKADYLPAHYSVAGVGEAQIFVVDDATAQIVKLYYKNDVNESVAVTLVYDDLQGVEQTIQSYVVERKPGTELTVQAPDLTAKGFTKTVDSVKVTKDQTTAKIKYTATYHTVTVKLLDAQTNDPITLDGFTLTYEVLHNDVLQFTAPSIKSYTLTEGDLVQSITVDSDKEITLKYTKTLKTDYVTHTIILTNQDTGTEITRYTSLVQKDANATTEYWAPTQVGMNVDAAKKSASNGADANVEFLYTEAAAKIIVNFVDQTGVALPGVEAQELHGYEKGQTVMVPAPTVNNMALAGLWNGTGVEEMTGKVTTEVTIPTDKNVVEVTFAYKPMGAFRFVLVDRDGKEIKTVTGSAGETFSTKTGGNLDLSASGWIFDFGNGNNTAPFNKKDAELTPNAATKVTEYKLYFTRQTRNVVYKYVDATDGQNKTNIVGFTSDANPTTANVGENLIVVAPQIPGYTPLKLREAVTVGNEAGDLEVTLEYRKKDSGSVTVEHKAGDKVISSYTASGSVGEWFTASVLALDNEKLTADGKYKFIGTDETKSVQISAAEQKIVFEYEENFVTVDTFTKKTDGAETKYEQGIEVVKTTGSQKLYAPSVSGYVLKGITVATGAKTAGSETTFPENVWDGSALTLTGLTANTKVVYHYVPIKDVVGDEQATVTVKAQYERYALDTDWTKIVTKDLPNTVSPKSYTAYTLFAYQIGTGAKEGVDNPENFELPINISNDETVTFFYKRADNSAVVPGKNNTLGDADDVVIKPNGTDTPTVDKDTGNVTVPDGGEVVVPGVGVIAPPDGSIVKPDGTIVAPGTDGSTNPGVKVDPTKPGETAGYISVTYHANGGVGESYTQMAKNGESITLIAVAGLFEKTGFKGTGWNTNDKGLGKPYAPTFTTDKSLVLYAQWEEDKDPTTDPNKYKGTIVLVPNGGNGANETINVSSDTANPILHKLPANTFTLEGWTFAYWLDDNGKVVTDTAIVEVANTKTLTLTAQWFSTSVDGSITVPGQDNKPNTTDDVTAKPNPNPEPGTDGSLKRDETTGIITVPNGGSVTTPKGEIDMPNGGTVKPDGTVTIKQPDGSDIVVKPDKPGQPGGGTEVIKPEGGKDDSQTTFTVTYQSGAAGKKDFVEYSTKTQDSAKKITVRNNIFTYDGYVFAYWTNAEGTTVNVGTELEQDTILTAHWYKQVDGGVEIPGNNGNVVVKPAPDEIGKDGSVEVKPDATVKLPDGSEITLPEGSKVNPDGTITGPDGSKIDPENPEAAGYCYVVYLSGEGTGTMPKQFVKMNAQFTPRPNAFTAPTDKKFAGWKNQKNEDVAENATFLLTESTTLTAQWAPENELTPPSTDTDNKYQEDQVTGETLLILRGDWAGEASHTLKAYINGEAATEGTVYWRLVVESYKDEFGFTNSSLNGSDIISLDATTGEILVKNSGIVRVECISTKDHTLKFSIVIIVPGDVNKDGSVDLMDASWVYDIYDKLSTVPAYDPENKFTLYQFELANLANVDKVLDLQDASAIIDLYDNVTSLKKTVS